MRAERLISILMTLQIRGQVTAEALAERLEVSTRTIYRDIDALSRSGVPVITDRGRGGGVSLVAGYKTELTGLSAAESEALAFVGLDAAAAALGLEASAEAARLKVFAALPAVGRARAHRARECFHLDPVNWYQRTTIPPHLRTIATATWTSQSVELDYASWTRRATRVVDPFGLVLKAGCWYLLGRLSSKDSLQVFRLESVLGVNVLARRFTRPKRFDLARAWQEQASRFETSLRKMKASLRVAPAAMSYIDRLGSEAAETIRASTPDGKGWRETTIWIESVPYAAGLLLGFSTDIEVLGPPGLREELALRARNLSELYRKENESRPPRRMRPPAARSPH